MASVQAEQRAMGARLKAVRETLNLTQRIMGEIMGVGETTVSGWEVGRNQIDLLALARAARHCGFTTDWIALGDMSGLRFDLAVKLQNLLRLGDQPAPARRGRPPRPGPADPVQGKIPLFRDVDASATPPRAEMHEPQEQFLPQPRKK